MTEAGLYYNWISTFIANWCEIQCNDCVVILSSISHFRENWLREIHTSITRVYVIILCMRHEKV